MTESHTESEKDEQICNRRDGHYSLYSLYRHVYLENYSHELVNCILRFNVRSPLCMTLWGLSTIVVFACTLLYFFPIFRQVSIEIPVLLVSTVTLETIQSKQIRLQLGSFQSLEDAERAWSQLTHRHGEILRDVPHEVVRVDLGGKGTWYRVYAGPYENLQRALLICNALKKLHSNCMLQRFF